MRVPTNGWLTRLCRMTGSSIEARRELTLLLVDAHVFISSPTCWTSNLVEVVYTREETEEHLLPTYYPRHSTEAPTLGEVCTGVCTLRAFATLLAHQTRIAKRNPLNPCGPEWAHLGSNQGKVPTITERVTSGLQILSGGGQVSSEQVGTRRLRDLWLTRVSGIGGNGHPATHRARSASGSKPARRFYAEAEDQQAGWTKAPPAR